MYQIQEFRQIQEHSDNGLYQKHSDDDTFKQWAKFWIKIMMRKTYLSCIGKPVLNLSARQPCFSAKEIFVSMRGIRVIHVNMKPCLQLGNLFLRKIRHTNVVSILYACNFKGTSVLFMSTIGEIRLWTIATVPQVVVTYPSYSAIWRWLFRVWHYPSIIPLCLFSTCLIRIIVWHWID